MSFDFDNFFIPVDEKVRKKEKEKAREIRNSQWWKNLRGQGLCHYCKERFHPSELTMDHVVPVIRGGKSSKSNLVACCKECNSQKSYLLPIEWQDYLNKLKEKSSEIK